MSERIWAVIDGGVIANTIVADDTFADVIRPDHDDVIEITDLDPCPGVGWAVVPGGYRPPQPGASWAWDEDAQQWIDTAAPAE